jgi:hypothetical protein
MTDVASLSVSATETGVSKVDSALLGLAKSAGVAEAATGRFSAASQKAARDNYTAWQSAGSTLPAFSMAIGKSSPIVRGAGAEMKNYGMHTANVFAQLNDIGMMMAAGQNPLQLALQQGTQLNQVWGQMGGKIGAVGAVLRGAFMSLLNPLNLVTIGVIAGGAALMNYFTSAGSGAKTFKENLDELESAIGNLNDVTNMYSEDGLAKLKEKYGTLNSEIMELIDNQRILALDEASRKLQSVLASMSGELGSGWLTTANGEVAELFETTSTGASLLLQYMSSIKDMKTFQEQADALAIMRENLSRATDGFTDMTAEQAAMFRKLVDAESQMRILEQSTRKAENAAIDLTASAPGAGWMASAISETNMLIGKLTKAKAVSDGLRNVKMGDLASQYGQYGAGRTSGEKLNRDASALYGGTGNVLDGMGYYDTSSGASGGGGGGSDPYQANLDRLMSSLMTERETVEKWYADNEVILNDRRAMELLGAAGHKEAMLDLERQYHEKLSKIKDDSASMSLTGMSTYFGELNSIAGGGFDGLIRAQKAFAAAQLAIDQVKALSAIWGDASIPFLAKGFAIGRTLAAFAGLKSALSGGKGASGGGSSKAPTSVGGAAAEPTRTTTVSFQGDPFMVAIAESVMSQMYEASGNGRVLIKA